MNTRLSISILTSLLALAACGPRGGTAMPNDPLDPLAESYVKLVLAVGRHDPIFVDAFYGPDPWKAEAESGAPVPLPDLLARSRDLLGRVRGAGGPEDRRRFLEKQLVAVEAHLRRLSGETLGLADECRALFDAYPARHAVAEFEAAHRELERLVPGPGSLGERIEAMRRAVYVPKDRIEAALRAALDAARTANAPFLRLPDGESFEAVIVTKQPWGAYNWYLGNYKSRIELNTDLPVELNNLLGTMCHEGYPGHHVYNVLHEQALVRERRWIEHTVYPLYSPESVLAEGTANVGIDIVYTDDERRRVLTEVLAPVAGVPAEAVLAADRIRDAARPLKYVNGEAAFMLLDEGKPEDEVVAFSRRWNLTTEERARKSMQFARTYRSYVFNYSLGEDLVRSWIGDGPDRRERFYDLLRRPVVPSDLTAR